MPNLSTFDPRRLLSLPVLYRLFQAVAGREKGAARVLKFLAISSGDRVLDIGCGTGDILRYLPADVDYHGFDLSGDYISAARIRFGAKGTFSVRAITPAAAEGLGQFDVVAAMGVLHHLSDVEADALFETADKVLRPEGRLVTCDGAFVPAQNPFARLLLRLDRGRYVRTPDQYLAIARRHFPNTTARVVHDLLSIPYTHCILEGVKAAQ
jgi:cyclopropane fatty-acyl-phospholipid synthase-like methyltransferase